MNSSARSARSPRLARLSNTGDFDVELVPLPDGAIAVRIVGELDMATAPTLAERIASIGAASRLVIDLTSCTFLDSAALRSLMAVARDWKAAESPLALVASDPGILRILEITGVDAVFSVHATLSEAL